MKIGCLKFSVFAVYHLGFCSKQFQSCNKSLINQACSGPSWENIGPWSFLYGPSAARSVLSRPWAYILPVRPSCLVNKIYIFPNFQNCARCEKDLKDNKHDSLHLARKYARIRFSEQIMSADKYPSIFSRQMEAIVYLLYTGTHLLYHTSE